MILVFLPNWPFYVPKVWFMTQVFPLPFKLLWSPDIFLLPMVTSKIVLNCHFNLKRLTKWWEMSREWKVFSRQCQCFLQSDAATVCPKRLVLFLPLNDEPPWSREYLLVELESEARSLFPLCTPCVSFKPCKNTRADMPRICKFCAPAKKPFVSAIWMYGKRRHRH